ncbi:dihydrolipoyl dehydrogenase [Pararhodospirillum oryzae]|uniref:Dihydrolipoyl dehydrogenase n=1 Tax=Pararhodospirillum oryzae TaxID=478448 RepID=A0A512H7V0_9PROT|nr:dihydrolipoyl dehydrogenase [Pararhodospirillum oryzae]GEO81508.1 dihydrolipoyl dehydrogenase [Pararhodospirillum oryzae]
MSEYDVVVIGGGPGGYVCAIRAAQLGLRVACVESRPTLGGTCLNEGCIPSKALLQSSHLYEEARLHFKDHGIGVEGLGLDIPAMMARKDEVVASNTKGIDFLFKKNKITRLVGRGRLGAPGTVVVSGADGDTTISATSIVLATGSVAAALPGVSVDEEHILSSTGALALQAVPRSLIVIGAGVIGLELGSVWRRLGAEVTVVEYLDYILPPLDGEVRQAMQKLLSAQGLTFHLGQAVSGAEVGPEGVSLTMTPAGGGDATTLTAEKVLVAVGRRPCTQDLGLEEAGVALTERGFIQVDENFQTSVEGVFAIGDVIGGMMLAHKAEEEGVALAEMLAGESGLVDHDTIPAVVYTAPEAASVGKTEEQLKAKGIAYRVGKFPFMANGRAKANGATDGFVKILADATTDRVLGCHIIGPAAGDLIQEVVMGMVFGTSAEDIARTCHAHPQLGESVKEAALAVHKRALHI